jgi:hypothetical protein
VAPAGLTRRVPLQVPSALFIATPRYSSGSLRAEAFCIASSADLLNVRQHPGLVEQWLFGVST